MVEKLYINLNGNQIELNKYINCNIIFNDKNIFANIKGRGNSTWSFPKKPYIIKFNENIDNLNIKKDKEYIFLANWLDKTSLRNIISLEISRRIMNNVPNCQFIDLYINNEYIGLYLMCESIDNLNYLIEFDINYNNSSFKTDYFNYNVKFKLKNINNYFTNIIYIKNFINNVEYDLINKNYNDLLKKIDIISFIDYFIIQELTMNSECNHPKSSFMYINENKLYAGPVWDFDWGTYSSNNNNFINKNALYYKELFNINEFKIQLKTRWNNIKYLLNIEDFYNTQLELIKDSIELNNKLWPIIDQYNEYPNMDKKLNFKEAAKLLKENYNNRIIILDKLILEL